MKTITNVTENIYIDKIYFNNHLDNALYTKINYLADILFNYLLDRTWELMIVSFIGIHLWIY